VIIKAIVSPNVRSKMVQLSTTSQSISLVVHGETIISGKLHKPIISDETTYVLEDVDDLHGTGLKAKCAPPSLAPCHAMLAVCLIPLHRSYLGPRPPRSHAADCALQVDHCDHDKGEGHKGE
jgi:hypothetical protein